mmetsp:Transcript_11050/g.27012  ORF Transcript_11050/g.27012 Transcript_11050/m.27012 type:complete len:273 (+) Transcript_11050:335-1153(+)
MFSSRFFYTLPDSFRNLFGRRGGGERDGRGERGGRGGASLSGGGHIGGSCCSGGDGGGSGGSGGRSSGRGGGGGSRGSRGRRCGGCLSHCRLYRRGWRHRLGCAPAPCQHRHEQRGVERPDPHGAGKSEQRRERRAQLSSQRPGLGHWLPDGIHDAAHAAPAAGVPHRVVHHIVRSNPRALARVVERQRHHLGCSNHGDAGGIHRTSEVQHAAVYSFELYPAPHHVLLPTHLGVPLHPEVACVQRAIGKCPLEVDLAHGGQVVCLVQRLAPR